jgi:hypothetical protein
MPTPRTTVEVRDSDVHHSTRVVHDRRGTVPASSVEVNEYTAADGAYRQHSVKVFVPEAQTEVKVTAFVPPEASHDFVLVDLRTPMGHEAGEACESTLYVSPAQAKALRNALNAIDFTVYDVAVAS